MPRQNCRPLLVVAALTLTFAACQRGPVPPQLAAFGTLDPAVATLLGERITAVKAARDSADAWGRLAMALDANGVSGQARDTYAIAAGLPANHGRWWYHLARMKSRDGDADGALAAYDQAIALSPDYVPARWRRGLVLLDRGDLAGAEAAFTVAVNLAPNDSAGVTGLARVQVATNRAREAAAALETLLERTPTDRYAYQVLATAYRGLGREREAADALAAGAKGEPFWDDPWFDEVGAFRRGFAATLKEATALSVEGRYDESIALLERLRVDRPQDRELRTYLGGVYATAGRFAEARKILDDVLAQSPNDFDATMHLATAHLFAGTYDEADRLVRRAQTLRPNDADAVRLRGVIAWRATRLDDAERDLAAAAAANPADAKALGWLGMVRQERGRSADALAAFKDALARDPLLPDALIGGASAALAAGDIDDAARWLARATRVAPSHPQLADLERRVAAKGKS